MPTATTPPWTTEMVERKVLFEDTDFDREEAIHEVESTLRSKYNTLDEPADVEVSVRMSGDINVKVRLPVLINRGGLGE